MMICLKPASDGLQTLVIVVVEINKVGDRLQVALNGESAFQTKLAHSFDNVESAHLPARF